MLFERVQSLLQRADELVEGVIMDDGGGKIVLLDDLLGFLLDIIEQLVQPG